MGGDEELYEILLKLGQQAAEASPEELERALEIASTNGDYLMMKFGLCMKRALARKDLTPDRKTNAKEDAATFMMLFDTAKRWPIPKLAAHAFEMATLALFAGLRAGLSPSEIAKLESDRQSELARRSKKKKLWFWYAKMLALKIPEEDRALPDAKIAERLWDDWAKEKPAEWTAKKPTCRSFDTLAGFVGELRLDGTYPQRPTRARRLRD